MPRLVYKPKKFGSDRLAVINQANLILEEYTAQGFDLTLRQLYYQFVSRGLIANNDREYSKLGSIVNEARLAGKIDWDHIVDRTRFVRELSTWGSPEKIMEGAAKSYRRDLWETQATRVEVWIEKDALVGVIEGICDQLRVPYLSCRGYTSQSEMWGASQRFYGHTLRGQKVVVLHLGDHDPSGIDMSRDIEERLLHFLACDYYRVLYNNHFDFTDEDPDEVDRSAMSDEALQWSADNFELRRLALNWDQVEQYAPPPNPAKITDSRSRSYISEYGHESWELDALEPSVIAQLIEDAVSEVRDDDDAWETRVDQEDDERSQLLAASGRWADVTNWIAENPKDES